MDLRNFARQGATRQRDSGTAKLLAGRCRGNRFAGEPWEPIHRATVLVLELDQVGRVEITQAQAGKSAWRLTAEVPAKQY